ncbi:MAG: hypothetical protein P9F75_07450 [Candidatus Contendobacter sp.]|nr:hypothetical protein [Candidatus Contendobacter sp.]
MNLHGTMAERAWRYGLETQPSRLFCPGWLFAAQVYIDNSAILFRPLSSDPIGVVHDLELLPYAETP